VAAPVPAANTQTPSAVSDGTSEAKADVALASPPPPPVAPTSPRQTVEWTFGRGGGPFDEFFGDRHYHFSTGNQNFGMSTTSAQGVQAAAPRNPGWLGLKVQDVSKEITEGGGILVAQIAQDGPLANLLRTGDAIVEVNGEKVSQSHEVTE